MSLDPSSLDARQQEHALEEEQQTGATPIDTEAEMATNAAAFTLSPGDQVFSSDGQEIGSIGSVKGGYFHLEQPSGDRFWLSRVYVTSARDGRVDLTLTAEGVSEHRLQKPGLETIDRGLAGTGDRVTTSIEALQMRERIEQELLAQRGTMDTDVRNQ